eukprot:2578580-Rhodomonas_salina.1
MHPDAPASERDGATVGVRRYGMEAEHRVLDSEGLVCNEEGAVRQERCRSRPIAPTRSSSSSRGSSERQPRLRSDMVRRNQAQTRLRNTHTESQSFRVRFGSRVACLFQPEANRLTRVT